MRSTISTSLKPRPLGHTVRKIIKSLNSFSFAYHICCRTVKLLSAVSICTWAWFGSLIDYLFSMSFAMSISLRLLESWLTIRNASLSPKLIFSHIWIILWVSRSIPRTNSILRSRKRRRLRNSIASSFYMFCIVSIGNSCWNKMLFFWASFCSTIMMKYSSQLCFNLLMNLINLKSSVSSSNGRFWKTSTLL